jgi:CMP-N-acetylneuraminate monooxygenase
MKIPDEYDIETDLSGVTIAELVEKEEIGDTLAEYGLYCTGCPASLGEDIIEAARIHGLDETQAEDLVRSVEDAVTRA